MQLMNISQLIGISNFISSGGGITYATWNPSDKNAQWTLSGGNLTAQASSSGIMRATIGASTGKKYFECTLSASPSITSGFGLAQSTRALSENNPDPFFDSNGSFSWLGSSPAYGTSLTSTSVVGIYCDLDAHTVGVIINGTDYGNAISSLSAGTWYPCVGSFSSSVQFTTNFGATAWTYAPPSGYTGWY